MGGQRGTCNSCGNFRWIGHAGGTCKVCYLKQHPEKKPIRAARTNQCGQRWCSGYYGGGHFTDPKNFATTPTSTDGLRNLCRKHDFTRRQVQKQKWIETLGGACTVCGDTDIKHLQVDHINGGGNQEHRQRGYVRSATDLPIRLSDPHKYQVLCANCHADKTWDENHARTLPYVVDEEVMC